VTVALPFLAVTFPPITDLPQHVAQVRLLFDALGDPGSPYRVQWLTPYSLVYGVLALAWVLVEPIAGGVAAGRLGMLVVALARAGAAGRRGGARLGAGLPPRPLLGLRELSRWLAGVRDLVPARGAGAGAAGAGPA
jgi:hypothetical protein